MNIQNALNIEANSESLKIENHIDVSERRLKEDADAHMEDFAVGFSIDTDNININTNTSMPKQPSNIYNPAPVSQNSLLTTDALLNKQR